MSCDYFHCANTVTVGTDAVVIDFLSPVTAVDKDRFCFKLSETIPLAGATLPVQVTVNGGSIPLWNKYGNPIIGSQLTKGRKYTGYYGATTPHVILQNTPMVFGCCNTIY
jgi:hypothetical protein